jgi:hypothetical protein
MTNACDQREEVVGRIGVQASDTNTGAPAPVAIAAAGPVCFLAPRSVTASSFPRRSSHPGLLATRWLGPRTRNSS